MEYAGWRGGPDFVPPTAVKTWPGISERTERIIQLHGRAEAAHGLSYEDRATVTFRFAWQISVTVRDLHNKREGGGVEIATPPTATSTWAPDRRPPRRLKQRREWCPSKMAELNPSIQLRTKRYRSYAIAGCTRASLAFGDEVIFSQPCIFSI